MLCRSNNFQAEALRLENPNLLRNPRRQVEDMMKIVATEERSNLLET
jgi:hypothetical protein